MQFFSTPRTARPTTPPPAVVAAAATSVPSDEAATQTDGCGWYDSSFDLSRGLEVSEQDSDLGYQLCQLLS